MPSGKCSMSGSSSGFDGALYVYILAKNKTSPCLMDRAKSNMAVGLGIINLKLNSNKYPFKKMHLQTLC